MTIDTIFEMGDFNSYIFWLKYLILINKYTLNKKIGLNS